MKDDRFIEIKFNRVLLLLTRDEFLRALRRGRITKKNRNAARKRQAGNHEQGLGKAMA